MHYIVLSIICSVSVGIIFKFTRRYDTAVTQIVAWNYVFALLLCYLFFRPELKISGLFANWPIYGVMSVLLPSIFLLMAASIKYMGIVKTDAAQRLSLFIPILAAWFIFGEGFNKLKLIGLAIGFPAILLIFLRHDTNNSNKWQYPALVLLGFGVIDVLFKQVVRSEVPYTTSLFFVFCGALAVATGIVLFQLAVNKAAFGLINLTFGALVGIFNFGNILFYMLAHKEFAHNPSTVFASMNMGVIILGSIAGILIFREKMSRLNYTGIAMALAAIIFITLSQIYAS
ncbi:transporter [Flavobacterium cyanobacteriorum]|uniref:Transporter n=1 Tax=Flavobacterium cyanobacteriorum TaxID=2022802 RepID=A0A255ZQ59_9FLAO|nr:DMT family transporter [Flavobacterium cyanobacteriorum]OYQ43633.1 transporter [Flavobacterium cyanobacteriorum]